MKTVEEAAQDYCAKERTTRSEYAAFIAGVEFAQRWIDIKDELPGEGVYVLLKYNGLIYLGSRFGDSFLEDSGQMNPDEDIPTHWRPIDWK